MCVRISPLLLPRCYRHPTFSYFSYKRSRQSATTSATYIPSVYYTDCVCTSKKLSADEIVYTVHPARAESGLVMAEHAARELEGMHACMRRRSIANPHRTSRRMYEYAYSGGNYSKFTSEGNRAQNKHDACSKSVGHKRMPDLLLGQRDGHSKGATR